MTEVSSLLRNDATTENDLLERGKSHNTRIHSDLYLLQKKLLLRQQTVRCHCRQHGGE